jgi:plastocyanin
MRRFSILVLVCLMAAFGLAACGGDDEGDNTTEATTPATTETTTEESAGGGGTIAVAADPGGALEFEQKSLTAKPGNNTVELTNSSSTPHDVVIEDDGGEEIAKTEVITDGTDETTADLQDGEYTFYCSVPGHRQAGMEGKLTVK